MTDLPESAILYLDSCRGQYLEMNFAEETDRSCIEGVDDEIIEILLDGPENEDYYEAWTTVLDNAVLVHPDTQKRYTLWQDGDLWLIPEDAEWPEESEDNEEY